MTLHDFTPPPTEPEQAPIKAPISKRKDIEKLINRRPIDYSWEYKRFKRSLPEEKNLYSGI